MKNVLKKRVWACLMVLIMCVSMLQSGVLYADTASEGNNGYVTVVFEDYGVRVAGDEGTEFVEPLGEILNVKVPCETGDTIATVTVKALEAVGVTYTYTGTVENGFFIDTISNFNLNGKTYGSFGSLSAGSMSGWMVSINNWFASTSSSETLVEDGDKIAWQYSCQWGADINYDYMMPSAEMTGIDFADANGVLAPEFTTEAAVYTYRVDENVTKVALEVSQANYGAQVIYTVGGKTYKPMQDIPVVSGTVIEITSEYTMWDGSPNLKDAINITILREDSAMSTEEPVPTETAVPTTETPVPTETTAPATAEPVPTEPGISSVTEAVYKTTEKWLVQNVTAPTYGTVGGDWAVLGLARSGAKVADDYYDTYYVEIAKVLKATEGVLHNRKYTEYERVILSLTAAGYDATDVNGYNLLAPLSDYDKVIWQGVNSAAYALLAFDSHNYEIPLVESGKTQTTRENLVAYLMEQKLSDGGWALNGTVSDADMTALAVQALAPYCKENADVNTAVDKAVKLLSEKQKEDGTFGDNTGLSNAESTAQVVLALTALGMNPDVEEAFVKNGNSVVDGLCSFAIAEGGFCHAAGGNRDGIATEQGFNALVSYFRMLENKTYLYDMSDVTLKSEKVDLPEETPVPTEKPEDGKISTQNPDNSNNKNNKNNAADTTTPKTGDTTNVIVVVCVMLMAGTVLLIISKRRTCA